MSTKTAIGCIIITKGRKLSHPTRPKEKTARTVRMENKARREIRVHKAQKALMARTARMVPKATRETKENKGKKVIQAQKALMARTARMEAKARRERTVRKARKVTKAIREHKGQRVTRERTAYLSLSLQHPLPMP